MANIIEALHTLARQRGRGDASPLFMLRNVPAHMGARISHLPISQRLAQAWIALTGQPFRQHQSLSLSALRRGEPFALVGGGLATQQTLHLLAFELLRGEPQATALLLAPNPDSVKEHLTELEQLTAALGTPLRVAAAQGENVRAAFGAHLVVTTPDALHDRLLRYHDRAWQGFWSHLQLILIAEAHHYAGVAAGHLSALLLRAQRLAPNEPAPFLGATMAEAQDANETLAFVAGQPWRLIPVDDVPRPEVGVALWRSGSDRAREAVTLALAMQRAGASAHIVCSTLEVPLLHALLGSDAARVSVGASPQGAQVQILIGADCGAATLHQAVDSGAPLTILLLGDDPAERTIARLCERDPTRLPLLDDPPPVWIAAPNNAYVIAQHLICAASERPISAAEVNSWQADSIVARLEAHQQLALLPEAGLAWQPLPGGGNPYEGFDLRAAGAASPIIFGDQGQPLATLDSAAFDRWAFLGAALPPLRGGYRVIGRNENELSLTIRAIGEGRRTFPLRHCTVRVRDRRDQRDLRGRAVAWGRVVVDEEIYGYREVTPNGAPVDHALVPALTTSWSAPALWVDLPMAVSSTGQMIGWSLAVASAIRTLLYLTDAVPAYDAEVQRLYFVDAQPGGNGLSAWLYEHLEDLLSLAYDIALDCRNDPLLEPLARADMDWLLALLGGTIMPTLPRQPVVTEIDAKQQVAGDTNQEPEDQVPEPRERAQERNDESQATRAKQHVAPSPEPESAGRKLKAEGRNRGPRTRNPEPETPSPEPISKKKAAATPAREAPAPARKSGRTEVSPSEPPASRHKKVMPRRSTQPAGSAAEPTPPPIPAPAHPPLPEPTAVDEPLPDPAAMVSRLRRMREQREQSNPPTSRRPIGQQIPAEPHFQAGDTIFCTPWGRGEVRSSQLQGDRELLVVFFVDYGDLTIDTSVSAVRVVNKKASGETVV
ncbi:MAG: helicase [Oscillochloris sp.]|nr:helicase [Oscillochloris sp.]